MMTLGIIKAVFFVWMVRWCLKNDQPEINPGDLGGGSSKEPQSPYRPRWPSGVWSRGKKEKLQHPPSYSNFR